MKNLSIFLIVFILCSGLKAQTITTVAGGGSGGGGGFSGEGGLATNARLSCGAYVDIDKSGNLYIADRERILKVNSATGIITTIAGTGIVGFNGDGIPATDAQIGWVGAAVLDPLGNLHINDGNSVRIRKVDRFSGEISTVIGNGILICAPDGTSPTTSASLFGGVGLVFDKLGNLYFSDSLNIRKISTSGVLSTIAGNRTTGPHIDGVPATTIGFTAPNHITCDRQGNVYFADPIGAVRKINIATGISTRVAGTYDRINFPYSGDGIPATNCHIAPVGLCVDSIGRVFIADAANNRVYVVDTFGIIRTVAGTGVGGYSGDGGIATTAQLYAPQGVTIDACGNVYISDFGNARIRKVTYNPTCTLSTLNVPSLIIENSLSIFPNPFREAFTVTTPKVLQSVQLCNAIGQAIYNEQYFSTAATINTAGLPVGLYFVHLTYADGTKAVQKVVKE